MKFVVIDECAVPARLGPEIERIKAESGATLNSCDRSPAAETILRRFGKKSQRELYEGFVKGLPGFNPANPPGKSTHERRNDGVAFPGPAGMLLRYWQVGMDWSNPDAVVRAASKAGFTATVTYKRNAREAHHLNFRKEPRLKIILLKRGSRGPLVSVLTRRLAKIRSPKTDEPYLPGSQNRYDESVEAAVRRFQQEHHQNVDGVYGPQTHRQLKVALRRWRETRAERREAREAEKEKEKEKKEKNEKEKTGTPG
jgi:hypothetical protein